MALEIEHIIDDDIASQIPKVGFPGSSSEHMQQTRMPELVQQDGASGLGFGLQEEPRIPQESDSVGAGSSDVDCP